MNWDPWTLDQDPAHRKSCQETNLSKRFYIIPISPEEKIVIEFRWLCHEKAGAFMVLSSIGYPSKYLLKTFCTSRLCEAALQVQPFVNWFSYGICLWAAPAEKRELSSSLYDIWQSSLFHSHLLWFHSRLSRKLKHLTVFENKLFELIHKLPKLSNISKDDRMSRQSLGWTQSWWPFTQCKCLFPIKSGEVTHFLFGETIRFFLFLHLSLVIVHCEPFIPSYAKKWMLIAFSQWSLACWGTKGWHFLEWLTEKAKWSWRNKTRRTLWNAIRTVASF
jgi:hypothetical protein